MKNKSWVLAGALGLFVMVGCNSNTSESQAVETAGERNEEVLESRNKDDEPGWFVAKAGSSGLLEVELGKLAASRATNPEVKQYAQMMVDHHGKANDELKSLANSKNLTVPATMGADHQDIYNEVAKHNGADFDKKYMDAMVKDHKEAISMFEDMDDQDDDAEIRSFATKTLPTLRTHLEQAQRIEDRIR